MKDYRTAFVVLYMFYQIFLFVQSNFEPNNYFD